MDREPAITVFLSGEDFYRTACHVTASVESKALKLRFHSTEYYLFSHSLELMMKAYLRTRGLTAQQLRSKKFGHKLGVLWAECVKQGLVTGRNDIEQLTAVIGMLSEHAETYRFRYVSIGYATVPGLPDVSRTATAMRDMIRPIVHEEHSLPLEI